MQNFHLNSLVTRDRQNKSAMIKTQILLLHNYIEAKKKKKKK